MLRWGWSGAAAVAVGALGLTACDPGAGKAMFAVTGAEEGVVEGPTVVCRPPGDGGETVTPTWEWSGEIGGEPATLSFTGLWEPTAVDAGSLVVGGRRYVALDVPGGQLVRQIDLDAAGTLQVAATLPRVDGGGSDGGETVEVTAALRCPSWPVGSLDASSSID